MVQNAVKHFHGGRYYLHAWCVMPNHLHVVYTALDERTPAGIHHSWKSYTAHEANKLLERTGAVWEREGFDHMIRTIDDLDWFIQYTENNPMAAGLCARPEDWPYSSAGTNWRLGKEEFGAGVFPCGAGVPPASQLSGAAGETAAPQAKSCSAGVPPASQQPGTAAGAAAPQGRAAGTAALQGTSSRDGYTIRSAGYAPYLDYRPVSPQEQAAFAETTLPDWLRSDLESKVLEHAALHLVPDHLQEVRRRKEELIVKTTAAVKERLTAEINYWDHRAAQLKDQELAGRVNARLNSGLARQRADELTSRLQKRMAELEQERKLSALPPVVLGGALIVPLGLLRKHVSPSDAAPPAFAADTERSERLAMEAVIAAERRLGYEPRDVSLDKPGYDVESSVPGTGKLRFIEVKGRAVGARTVTVTRNEIITGFNKPDDFILAIGQIDGDDVDLRYVRRPFGREPDFGVTSVNYDLDKLLERGEAPA